MFGACAAVLVGLAMLALVFFSHPEPAPEFDSALDREFGFQDFSA